MSARLKNVKLTKQLFKRMDLPKKIKGFSYELLVLHLRTFDDILKALIRENRIC